MILFVFEDSFFHTSLVRILESLKDSMTTYKSIKCADGCYCYAIIPLGHVSEIIWCKS